MTTTTSTRPSPNPETTPSTGAFTTSYRALVGALKTLALPTTGRKSLPVFTRIRATVRAGHLVLTTFDFDTAVTVTVPATGTTAGEMLLDHPSITKILSAAAKGLSKAAADRLEVTVTTPDHTPVVHTNGYSLPLDDTVPVDAFPDLPATTPSTHVVDRQDLVALVERVTVAADRGDTLPILTGILANLDTSTLTLTATDRYRLASGTIAVNGTSTEKVLIPAVTLSKLLPHLSSPQTRMGVDVIAGITWVTVADDNTTIRIRTLDGEYPKVSSILNQEPTRSVTLARAALLQAATRAASLSAAVKATNSPVMITVTGSELTVAPATVGDRTKVTAPALQGAVVGETDRWVTGANPAFLLAAIATLSADEVTLHLTDPSRPMVLTDADSTDYRHVLMPVRFAQ
ncbi:MAG: DNA polymerase III subunit beta [Nocardioides sp.]